MHFVKKDFKEEILANRDKELEDGENVVCISTTCLFLKRAMLQNCLQI